MHSARSRIRLVTALISGAALAAGTLGTAGAASAAAGPNRPGAPTVPAAPAYAFGSGATSVFGETWNAADHQLPGAAKAGTTATALPQRLGSALPAAFPPVAKSATSGPGGGRPASAQARDHA